jgi:hypothetical protein
VSHDDGSCTLYTRGDSDAMRDVCAIPRNEDDDLRAEGLRVQAGAVNPINSR